MCCNQMQDRFYFILLKIKKRPDPHECDQPVFKTTLLTNPHPFCKTPHKSQYFPCFFDRTKQKEKKKKEKKSACPAFNLPHVKQHSDHLPRKMCVCGVCVVHNMRFSKLGCVCIYCTNCLCQTYMCLLFVCVVLLQHYLYITGLTVL